MPNEALTAHESTADRADKLCQLLRTAPTHALIHEARALLSTLQDQREFLRLCDLAELVCRFLPDDFRARRHYAQGLIETGRLIAATTLLADSRRRVREDDAEYTEIEGLSGRAYKQLFMETRTDEALARDFLEKAIAAYRVPYERDPEQNFWHGINLSALARAGELRGFAPGGTAEQYARRVLASLDRKPQTQPNSWWLATKAEAHIALLEWDAAEEALHRYVDHDKTTPFALAATLRQLRELWAIQRENRGARLLQILEAMLMSRPQPGAVLQVQAQHLREMRDLEPRNDLQQQRFTGSRGLETLEWYRTGLQRAGSVAAIKERLGLRFGTGFAVEPSLFGVDARDAVLLLTNYHVINSGGREGRKDFGNVEVVFEAAGDRPFTCAVSGVIAESPADNGLDYALVRLRGATDAIKPIPVRDTMEAADSKARVYVIGYPLGNALQFSLEDNILLDHECEPTGKPPRPARRRVHYSATTEEGSSGSPVFDDKWDCIALHHAGGKRDVKRERYGIEPLNGKTTLVEANEGIWIGSVRADVKSKNLKLS